MFRFSLKYVFLFLFFISCEEKKENEYRRIEGKIFFSIAIDSLVIPQNNGNHGLLFKTEKTLPCYNYRIIHSTEILPSNICLNIEGVRLDDNVCASIVAPASSEIVLEKRQKSFNLNLNYKSESDNYFIQLNDSSAVVTPIDTVFTRYIEFFPGKWWEY